MINLAFTLALTCFVQEPSPQKSDEPVPSSSPFLPVPLKSSTESPLGLPGQLEKRVQELEARLEDGRPGLNLARTSLASVTASSVNGERAGDDPYYGVLNAFDDGAGHQIQRTLYSSWMPSPGSEPWIDVELDEPVVVHSVQVDGECQFSAQLVLENGEELVTRRATERVRLEEPLAGVVRVRIRFGAADPRLFGALSVGEVRILGQVPAGVAYERRAPRLRLDSKSAEAIARGDFARWHQELLGDLQATTIQEADGTWVVTLRCAGRDVMRVSTDGQSKIVEPLIELVPIGR